MSIYGWRLDVRSVAPLRQPLFSVFHGGAEALPFPYFGFFFLWHLGTPIGHMPHFFRLLI